MGDVFQIWVNWDNDTIGVGSEEECSILQSDNPENIEIVDTFVELDEAEDIAQEIASERCLEYKPIN